MKKIEASARKEEGRFYKSKLIWYRIRHGMILLSIRNLLLRLNINLFPYWIEQESLAFCSEPGINEEKTSYALRPVETDTLRDIFEVIKWDKNDLVENPESPYEVMGLYLEDELAAFTIMRFGQFTVYDRVFHLRENEAYLEKMYTFENFRGKRLAPYLRYKCYEYLAEQEKSRYYSVTHYFNTASRRFKAKLNVQHAQLYLYLDFFGKYRRTFLLKKYRPSQDSGVSNGMFREVATGG